MSTDLIETMKGEGWTFKRPCTAFMACSMRIHGFMPNGRPFRREGRDRPGALLRHTGAAPRRIAAHEGAAMSTEQTTEQGQQCRVCGDKIEWFWPANRWVHHDLRTRDHDATPSQETHDE